VDKAVVEETGTAEPPRQQTAEKTPSVVKSPSRADPSVASNYDSSQHSASGAGTQRSRAGKKIGHGKHKIRRGNTSNADTTSMGGASKTTRSITMRNRNKASSAFMKS